MKPLASQLGNFLDQFPFSEEDDERARKRIRAANVQAVESWAKHVSDSMPQWKWARMDNDDWCRRVDPRIIDAVRAWKWVVPKGESAIVAGKGIALLAPTGSGKSSAIVARLFDGLRRLVAWADREEVSGMPVVMWTREADLVADQWAGGDLCSKAKRADVLIVDELGFGNGERAPTGKPPVIMDLFFRRYDDHKATSLTSGLSSEQLAERYGTALYRRLSEGSTIVDITKAQPCQ